MGSKADELPPTSCALPEDEGRRTEGDVAAANMEDALSHTRLESEVGQVRNEPPKTRNTNRMRPSPACPTPSATLSNGAGASPRTCFCDNCRGKSSNVTVGMSEIVRDRDAALRDGEWLSDIERPLLLDRRETLGVADPPERLRDGEGREMDIVTVGNVQRNMNPSPGIVVVVPTADKASTTLS